MYSTLQQSYIRYCVLKSGKLIFHIYSRYYFSFEQFNYTLSPTTPVFVEYTIYNCNFCLRKNPVAQASNINIKTSASWDTNNILPNINFITYYIYIYMINTYAQNYKRKDKKEKLMTTELVKQINKKHDIYVDWITK